MGGSLVSPHPRGYTIAAVSRLALIVDHGERMQPAARYTGDTPHGRGCVQRRQRCYPVVAPFICGHGVVVEGVVAEGAVVEGVVVEFALWLMNSMEWWPPRT